MWTQKRKFIYLVFLINIFAVVFLSGYFLLFKNWNGLANLPSKNLGQFWRNNFVYVTLYIDFAFCAITCWQNEKINLSQNWHLAAFSERKTILAYIFFLFLTYYYYFMFNSFFNY